MFKKKKNKKAKEEEKINEVWKFLLKEQIPFTFFKKDDIIVIKRNDEKYNSFLEQNNEINELPKHITNMLVSWIFSPLCGLNYVDESKVEVINHETNDDNKSYLNFELKWTI